MRHADNRFYKNTSTYYLAVKLLKALGSAYRKLTPVHNNQNSLPKIVRTNNGVYLQTQIANKPNFMHKNNE